MGELPFYANWSYAHPGAIELAVLALGLLCVGARPVTPRRSALSCAAASRCRAGAALVACLVHGASTFKSLLVHRFA
jgi:hypothetical protein